MGRGYVYAPGKLKRICGRFYSFPGDMDIHYKTNPGDFIYIYIHTYIIYIIKSLLLIKYYIKK